MVPCVTDSRWTVTTGVPTGTGYLLSRGVAQIVTDGQVATE